MEGIRRQLRSACMLLLLMTFLMGFIYPMVVTGLSQLFFSWRANGSLITVDDKIVGSELIGQSFTNPRYFWPRPSATLPFAYNAAMSSGSNLSAINDDLMNAIKARIQSLQFADPTNHLAYPLDLLTASGSGLDPDISPSAAFYQVHRVAQGRRLTEQQILQLVEKSIKKRSLGLLGEPRINVLQLNLDLDALEKNTNR